MKLRKCNFAVSKVEFLGHYITRDGIKPSLLKTKAVEKLAVSKNVKGTRQFLGLTGWFRRFIKDYARRTRSLAGLTKDGQPFVWSDNHQAEFEDLKKALCLKPVLKLPEYQKLYTLGVDASKEQIGES